jgi:isopentenyldiphosphate isomerase
MSLSEEQFDVLDCTGRKTGDTIDRDAAHATGVWHGAFHCLIVYQRKRRGCALFQLRSLSKKIAPGKYDVSVGGHYSAGEGAEDAGPREIREELGLSVEFPRLVSVGRRVFVYCFQRGVREYEIQDVFLLPFPGRPEGMQLQDAEVDALLEMDVEQGLELFSGLQRTLAGRFLHRDGREQVREVTATDFVPCIDNYYYKLLFLAHRYFRGERRRLVI